MPLLGVVSAWGLIVFFHPLDYLTLFESNIVLKLPVHRHHSPACIAIFIDSLNGDLQERSDRPEASPTGARTHSIPFVEGFEAGHTGGIRRAPTRAYARENSQRFLLRVWRERLGIY